MPGVGRRRPSANAQNRLTIANISEKDAEEGISSQVLRAARPMTPTRPAQKAWPTAEEEKKLLYENAVARVQKVQGTAAMANATAASDVRQMLLSFVLPLELTQDQISSVTSAPTTPKKSSPWPTAEAEKVRLYEQAQATAKRTQAHGVSSPSIDSRSSSEANSPSPRDKPFPSNAVAGPAVSPGAAMYQKALSSITPNANGRDSPSSQATPPSPPSSTNTRMPHYPSAEEEKAALRRYHKAKLAVDRSQNTQFTSREGLVTGSSDQHTAPVSYDTLYPEPNDANHTAGSDLPPPFEASGSGSQSQFLDEKERLRGQYEAQDAAALAGQAQVQDPFSYTEEVPSYTGPPPEENGGMSEKEILKARLDEQERVALLHQQRQRQQQQQQLEQEPRRPAPKQTPPRVNGSRAPPVPPTVNGIKPLTAAEEKAQLRAKYAAEGQGSVDGHAPEAPSRHPYATATPKSETPPPPPLMPRPPVEYIQETREADLRGRYYDTLGVGSSSALDSFAPVHPRILSPVSNPRLEMRPFSPFDPGLGYDTRFAIEPVHGQVRLPPPPHPAAQY